MPTHSNTNEEGKNEILVQSKEEPYSCIIPGGWAEFFWGQVSSCPSQWLFSSVQALPGRWSFPGLAMFMSCRADFWQAGTSHTSIEMLLTSTAASPESQEINGHFYHMTHLGYLSTLSWHKIMPLTISIHWIQRKTRQAQLHKSSWLSSKIRWICRCRF